MSKGRFLDPHARAGSFSARRGGMRDDAKLGRTITKLERGLAPAIESGASPPEWHGVEAVDALPEATADVIGRLFYKRNDGSDDTFNVGVTGPDGTPYIVGLNVLVDEAADTMLALDNEIAIGFTNFAVCADASGNIYTADRSGVVRKHNAAGVLQWSTTIVSNDLQRIATDGTSLFITDNAPAGTPKVYKRLCSTGAAGSPATIGTFGTGNGQYTNPSGVATDGTFVWIGDFDLDRVAKFTVGGTWQSNFATSDGIFGLSYHAATGNLLAALANNTVAVHNASGVLQFAFGSAGNANGQFQNPYSAVVDGQGRIWVSDGNNYRIQLFDGAGNYLAKVGAFGSLGNRLNQPIQLAITTADKCLIADSINGRISAAVAVSKSALNYLLVAPAVGQVLTYDGTRWINAYGGRTLLAVANFSGVASVVADGVFTSEFENYEIEVNVDSTSVAGASFNARCRAANADLGANHDYLYFNWTSANVDGAVNGLAQTGWVISFAIAGGTKSNLSGGMRLSSPANAARQTRMRWDSLVLNTGVDWRGNEVRGWYRVATAVDGIKFLLSAGVMSGDMRIYGLRDD